MENGTFAPIHFSQYFQKSYISKASKGACVDLWVNMATISYEDYILEG